MMLFGILRIMAEDAGVKRKASTHREHEDRHEVKRTSFHDLLHSPMTLAQGAAIMNAYRKEIKGEENEEDEEEVTIDERT